MKGNTITPDPRYLAKLRLILVILALVFLANGVLIGWLVTLDEEAGPRTLPKAVIISAIVNAVWLVPGLLLTGPYYHSLRYEIREDEVVVRAGIITQSVKHVPFRTVTNLTVKRGPLDRWVYNLGTLDIQTAGAAGSTGPEESLAGLADYSQAYEAVAAQLRRFRAGMAPTGVQPEEERALDQDDYLRAILSELQGIRQELADRQNRQKAQ
jgi:membrane protein YdbS with pleckstrin-like domain